MRPVLVFLTITAALAADPRHISTGSRIPSEGYADQPYIQKTRDGAWLLVVTTGKGKEGEGGQHVISTRSLDRGRTWSAPVDVEPADGPEASYAVTLQTPVGRIYVFYNHNTDNVREVKGDLGPVKRVDSLGHFVFKYTDDGGKTWSRDRYDIPMRDFEIDRRNVYGGKLKFFWNVGRAFAHKGAGYVPLHKVGGFGEGFFTSSEGVLLRSANILTESDPRKIRWETLPDGDVGLRTPPGGGPIAEEQSFSELSDGSLFVVYRSIDGHAVCSYSRDGGRTWEPPEYMRFADGRLMKHPRAANFAWHCENGKFLYWFHNHGGRFIREHPRVRSIAYNDRNPVWLSGGVEVDSPRGKRIAWSQPEIALYDDDPAVRMSYPDLVEDGGRYYLTETQKTIARVHEIDPTLLAGLWGRAVPGEPREGFSIDVQLIGMPAPGELLVERTTAEGAGFTLRALSDSVELTMNDGRTENRWRSDPGTLKPGSRIVAIADWGPRIVMFVTDGRFNDGGDARQFGWGRFSPHLRPVNDESVPIRSSERARGVTIFGRALRVAEAIP